MTRAQAAVITRAVGALPHDTETARRLSAEALLAGYARTHTATGAQRRALALRDAGCAMPGCPVPPAGCIAHHLRCWSRHGPTDLDNLALLCPTDHSAVHLPGWAVALAGDGVVDLTPPPSLDPDHTRRHHERHTGRRAGRAHSWAAPRGSR